MVILLQLYVPQEYLQSVGNIFDLDQHLSVLQWRAWLIKWTNCVRARALIPNEYLPMFAGITLKFDDSTAEQSLLLTQLIESCYYLFLVDLLLLRRGLRSRGGCSGGHRRRFETPCTNGSALPSVLPSTKPHPHHRVWEKFFWPPSVWRGLVGSQHHRQTFPVDWSCISRQWFRHPTKRATESGRKRERERERKNWRLVQVRTRGESCCCSNRNERKFGRICIASRQKIANVDKQLSFYWEIGRNTIDIDEETDERKGTFSMDWVSLVWMGRIVGDLWQIWHSCESKV